MARLRIMTANLLVDRADPGALDRVLRDVDPDVLGVQELGARTAAVIADLYEHGSLAPRDDGFGLGLVAKRKVETTRLELPVRRGWAGRLSPTDWSTLPVPLDVIVAHLPNPIDRPWRATQRDRRTSIDRIRSYLEDRDAASVVMGDMNSTPLWPEYRLLTGLGVDAAAATGTTRRTWSHFLRGPRLLRIDHAFVALATPVSTHTRRIPGTDHAALVIDIEIDGGDRSR